ncbi:MAG: glycogen-branching enzyme, partial [Blautia sp.]|nr:glycogen-branching enzyme [Blautia sp.]
MAGISEYMNWPRIEAVIYGEEASPRDVMGPKLIRDGVLIQGFFPGAKEVEVLAGNKKYPMELQDEAGYFAVLLPLRKIPSYTYHVCFEDREYTFSDAYAFPGQITEEEEKQFLAGVWYGAFEKLGAHPASVGKVKGTYFAVWAPNATRVSVLGDFNNWNGKILPMHRMPMSGIFELFVPDVKPGTLYKYEIISRDGTRTLKADPYAFEVEKQDAEGLKDASVVADLSGFAWNDEEWMKTRCAAPVHKVPVSIYETGLLDWEKPEDLVQFVKSTDYTHVELHPVMEYLEESRGAYSTFSYFAPTSRFGTPEDFRKLVDALHQAGIGVILDWTPAQFPEYESGLQNFDGTPLYEVQNPLFARHPFWNTFLYNYESPMV